MKKLLIVLLAASLFTACGKSKSGKEIAEEICECSKKANGLPTSDTTRASAQADCIKKQGEAWNKVKDDLKKADEFNKTISDCASEQIKKSFGQ